MNYKQKYEWMSRVVWVLGGLFIVGIVVGWVAWMRGRMSGAGGTSGGGADGSPVIWVVRENPMVGAKTHDWDMKPQRDPSWNQQHTQQQLGFLQMETNPENPGEKPVLLPLFGQSLRYKSSDRWLYFTATDQYQSIRLPVEYESRDCSNDDTGCREIYTGDRVKVPSYNNATFIVQLYKTRP